MEGLEVPQNVDLVRFAHEDPEEGFEDFVKEVGPVEIVTEELPAGSVCAEGISLKEAAAVDVSLDGPVLCPKEMLNQNEMERIQKSSSSQETFFGLENAVLEDNANKQAEILGVGMIVAH